ncbi:MAG: T9SS type A sorting domain-containing protein [Candidatus Glassbacteria bacterium]|nr:T9SS type A sorting domain-containing protein [Candidatus Glassbacteria bacterium]
MKKYLRLLTAFLLLLPAGLSSYTEVNEDLSGSTTWDLSGSPYVLTDSIRLMVRDTLNIEAGVVVKSATPWSGLIVYGILNLQGTVDSPVVFTSLKDDSYCGDTNGDGFATLPAPGDWSRLWIRNTWQDLVIQYAVFRYGGQPYDYPGTRTDYYGVLALNGSSTAVWECRFEYNEGGVFISNCSPQIVDCAFEHCSGSAVQVHGVFENRNDACRPVVSGNTFSDVEWPFSQQGSSFPIYSGNTLESSVKFKCVLVSGEVSADTARTETLGKFQGGSQVPYLLDNFTISINVTLNIEAGVIIKIDNGDGLKVKGKLNLPEDGGEPVVFTSFKDDSYGGDTNGDGYASSPSAGDYRSGLAIQSPRENTVQNAVFRYGGAEEQDDSTSGALQVDGCSPTIRDCSFEHNEVGVGLDESSATLRDCAFEDNSGYAVCVDSDSTAASRPAIANNSFSEDKWPVCQQDNSFPTYSGNVIEPSVEHKGILVSGTVSSDTNKTETLGKFQGASDIPYVIDGSFNIEINVTLNLEPGVVIKGMTDSSSLNVEGVLNAKGTSGSPVVFTSFKDDSYGGDTDGGGDASTPAPGDWGAVKIDNPTGDSDIRNALFRYGGGTDKGALDVEEGSPTVENCVFEKNDKGVYNEGSGTPVVKNCDFTGNTGAGVENANPETVMDCRDNYWGDSSGPSADTNPGGSGAAVIGRVDITGFLSVTVNLIGRGDLNADGSVDVSDLVRVINIILERGPAPSAEELLAADANGDGAVDVADLVRVIDLILGRSGGILLASSGRSELSAVLQEDAAAGDGQRISAVELVAAGELEPCVALLLEISVDRLAGRLSIFSEDPSVAVIGNRVKAGPPEGGRDLYRFLVFSTSGHPLRGFPEGVGFSFDSRAEVSPPTGSLLEAVRLVAAGPGRGCTDLTDKLRNSPTGGGETRKNSLPRSFSLGLSHPNPFNPSTSIPFTVPESLGQVQVRLAVYDARGALVATLVNTVKSPGAWSVQWDGTDSRGRPAASGVYFYRLETRSGVFTRKMVLLR